MIDERVANYLNKCGYADRVTEFSVSSATVALAAKALGCEESRIAKSLAFRNGDGAMVVVLAGDARIFNGGFKRRFGFKPSMLDADETKRFTGFLPGGVCPFALDDSVPVYLDESLKRFDFVYPAAGTASSAVRLSVEELFSLSKASGWVDVAKDWQQE